MGARWTLTLEEPLFARLSAHLFPGDRDEHGAVIAAGVAVSARGTRLLARDLFLAEDGVDFVPGRRGYRMLTAEFVSERIRDCRDQGLAYLAVHNHGGRNQVEFSDPDNRSHERGYPALLDISGQPVGALVVAENALAGDIWTPDRVRRPLSESIVLGRNRRHLYPSPPPRPPKADPTYDRQTMWFGDRGQDLLRQTKIGVVGSGGVGLPLVTQLGRLGVGTIVVIDPDRVEDINLPRLPEATRRDAMMPLRRVAGSGSGRWAQTMTRLANRLSIRKIAIARRVVRRANQDATFIGIASNVMEPKAALELVDCDYIFLAADSHLARLIVNAIAHQYLIPAVQLGTRIDVDEEIGRVGDIRTNVRWVLPGTGCMRCNNLISATHVQDESVGNRERERNRYVDEVPAPSVITFNTWAASHAATDFLLMMGELIDEVAPPDYLRNRPRARRLEPIENQLNRFNCVDCGTAARSRRARGDAAELPLPERS